jgi:hypothetical protein
MIKLKSLLKEVSDEAYAIHRFTNCGQDAAQNFIDDNNIDAEKLVKYLKKTDNEGLRNRYMVRDIIGGKVDKKIQQKFIKSFISLNENTTFDFAQASGVEFYASSPKNNIVLLPKSRKEIEKIDTIKEKLGDGADDDFLSLLKIRIEKKLGISVIPNKRYEGAGYAFDIDIDELIKKL